MKSFRNLVSLDIHLTRSMLTIIDIFIEKMIFDHQTLLILIAELPFQNNKIPHFMEKIGDNAMA